MAKTSTSAGFDPAVAAALRSAGRAGSVTLTAIANALLPRPSAKGATLTWSGTSDFATTPPIESSRLAVSLRGVFRSFAFSAK